ncbi:MAG: GAF domain-containing protein [Anaerolineae bacterium]|nr:GAF domain-containing protein [Anaerolineae bacterium]
MHDSMETRQPGMALLEDIDVLRRQLIRNVYRALVVVGALAVLAGGYYAYLTGDIWLLPLYLVSYGLVVLFAFGRRVPYSLQAGLLMGLIYLIGALDFFQDGRGGSGRLFLLAVPVMGALFFGRRVGWGALALSILTLAAIAAAFSTGIVSILPEAEVRSTDPVGWVTNVAVVLLLGVLLISAVNYMFPRLATALDQSRELALEVEQRRANLETQVAERTQELERRARYLQASAVVAREAASVVSDLPQLLDNVARVVGEQFGFYHVGLFILDEQGEWAELRAASSAGGRQMLVQGHRLRVGERGIVGNVAGQGEYRVAHDIGQDAVFFDNPLLPDTRSEIALPLRVGSSTIGVLDVQSTAINAFTDEDVTTLQALADQIALAISNARLFQQVQESVAAERRAYGESSRQAWQNLLRAQPDLGYLSDGRGVRAADLLEPQMAAALEAGINMSDAGQPGALSIPIRVRGEVIGVVDGLKPDGSAWSAQEVELLEAMTEQLNVALEGARLYGDTQRRAAREQMIGQVTGRIRESLDITTVIKTAVQEIVQSLGLAALDVRLAPPEPVDEP